MRTYPVPTNEIDRLQSLHDLRMDFSVPILELQKLAEVASFIADTPVALISLVDDEVLNFAANVGLPGLDVAPREVAFCSHAIMGSDQLVIQNALEDPRFSENPLVTGDADFRAYAGSVLEPEDGIRLGTLCVIDNKPRKFRADVLKHLDDLSDAATALLLAHRDQLRLKDSLEHEIKQKVAFGKRALLDPLTGLLNQAGFRVRSDEALDRSSGTEALAVFDVDYFKQVNDRWGHPFGDRYLACIAQCLVDGLGSNAIVGRIGGDEFAALLLDGTQEDHMANLDRVCTCLREAAADMGTPELGRLSIGMCAVANAHHHTFEAMYQHADVALYASKERGRNMITVFSDDLNARYNLRALQARFTDALALEEIDAFFQPKVQLADGSIVGFELLARWRDPKRGLLTPAYFEKILTDQAAGPLLTRRMLRRAIETHLEARRGNIMTGRLAINVTHYDLADPDFVKNTEWLLFEAGLDWTNLGLEIAERTILDDADSQIRRAMEHVREHGGEIALDDFGTGHAGLTHLRDWPIDTVKLDATFVADIENNLRDEAIVSSMIELAQRLDLTVVAEGIETAAVAKKLRDLGCAQGQGYLFSPAVEQAEALKMSVQSSVQKRNLIGLRLVTPIG